MAGPARKLAGRPPVDLSGPPAAPAEKVPPPVPAIPPGWVPAAADPEAMPDEAPAYAPAPLPVPDDHPPIPVGPNGPGADYRDAVAAHAAGERCQFCDPAYAPDPDADGVAAEALRSWDDPDPSVDVVPSDDPNAYVNLSDVLAALAGLRADVDRLLTATGIIGEQQQFMTNSMSAALEQFQQMMGAGGPMKMLGAMFGGGRKGPPQ